MLEVSVCSSIGYKVAVGLYCYFSLSHHSWDGMGLRGLLLSETLLKAIFHVHSSLHVRTSFLPFTVDVSGAISRAHHKLSSLCNCLNVEDWNKCLGLAGGLKHLRVNSLVDDDAIVKTTWNKNMTHFLNDWTSELKRIWTQISSQPLFVRSLTFWLMDKCWIM